ncbi:MAG: hypothetical protein WD557_19980 [Dehalococcoidia bacterium]
MTQAPETELLVRYEGTGSGAHEIWGGTQANFLVAANGWPGAREVAVMLNDPAAALLAESAGAENTDEFRAEAANRVGEAVIRERHRRLGHVDAVVTVSRATLEEHPELLEAVKP